MYSADSALPTQKGRTEAKHMYLQTLYEKALHISLNVRLCSLTWACVPDLTTPNSIPVSSFVILV